MDESREELLHILKTLDIDKFREVVGDDDSPDDIILESMHLVRVDHFGIPYKKKQDSRRWLEQHGRMNGS